MTPGCGIVLPADWWVVPLGAPGPRRRAVDRLVAAHPHLPADLRRTLRSTLTVQAAQAAAGGGWLLALMLGRVRGVPLPLTLTAARVPGDWSDDAGRQTTAALAAQVGADGRLDAGTGPFGLVLRTVRERTGQLPGAPAAKVPVLLVDHWTDPADGHGLVRLTASTPVLALRDGWLDLCDAIAATLHHAPPGDTAPVVTGTLDPAPAGDLEHAR